MLMLNCYKFFKDSGSAGGRSSRGLSKLKEDVKNFDFYRRMHISGITIAFFFVHTFIEFSLEWAQISLNYLRIN